MPKKVVRLSDLEIKSAKLENTSKNKTKKLSDGEGLALFISAAGGKSWRFNYRLGGKRGEVTLGRYPGMSLAQARRARDEARALVEQGIDPASVRRQEKVEVARQHNTFEKVAREWHARQARRWSPDHAARALGRLENHLFQAIGSVPIDEVTPQTLLAVLHALEEGGKHETAHRLRGLADNVFAFAIAAQMTNDNPAAAVAKALAPTITVHRAAIVDPEGVGRLLRAVWGYLGSPLVRGCLQVTALTAARPGEVRGMAWEEVQWEGPHGPLWVIPAARTKLRRDHLIPLAPHTLTILAGLRDLTGGGALVFPNSRDGERPISDMAMNMALRKLGFGADQHCAHGFRSTFSTLARENGQPHHVIEAALAHVQGSSVAQAYDRAQYLPERRNLLEWWAGFLDGLRAGAKMTRARAEDF